MTSAFDMKVMPSIRRGSVARCLVAQPDPQVERVHPAGESDGNEQPAPADGRAGDEIDDEPCADDQHDKTQERHHQQATARRWHRSVMTLVIAHTAMFPRGRVINAHIIDARTPFGGTVISVGARPPGARRVATPGVADRNGRAITL